MNTPNFWRFFEAEAYPQLGHRRESLRYVFEYLDRLNRPVFAVETGCVRIPNNWDGDGQSTVLFDAFVSQWPRSVMHTVDIDPKATALCSAMVSSNVKVHTGDSVVFLRGLARNPPADFRHLDVLYLDSLDVDYVNPHASALHHMNELVAASSLVGPSTLVVVDDSPSEAVFIADGKNLKLLTLPEISGKGKYVAAYAKSIGLSPAFMGYQAGWIGF